MESTLGAICDCVVNRPTNRYNEPSSRLESVIAASRHGEARSHAQFPQSQMKRAALSTQDLFLQGIRLYFVGLPDGFVNVTPTIAG